MRKLAALLTIATIALPVLALADDANQCQILDAEVICTISSYCYNTNDGGSWAMYKLSTTHQTVSTINVDAGIPGVCQFSTTLGPAAARKLAAQAEQLKAAGVCKVIIDNID